jgi:cytochrome P450
MLQQDPPSHTRLRKLVSKAFTPRAIESLRPRVERLVDGLLDRAAERGHLDVIADLALPVPSTVICEMMGVPLEDRDRFTDWTAAATHLLASQLAPKEVIDRGILAVLALGEYFGRLVAERRKRPTDDLLSALVQAEEAGDRLSEEELLSQSIGLLIAGFETTIGLIGNGVLALIRHPEQRARLRADPTLVGRAVEECLRFDGPIVLTVRILRENTRFGDRWLPKDAQVMAMLAAANRDPAHFPDPDRFDVGRTPNDHLAFGGGVHFCLGAHLARMEAQVAIGKLVQRFGTLALRSESRVWGKSLFRVLGELPIAVSE